MTLQRLLHGVSPRDFFKDYWGKKPLLIKRNQPLFYQSLFSLSDVDGLLFSGRLRPGEYRISESTEGIDLQYRDRGELDKSPPLAEFYRAFNSGKSLVLHGLNLRWPPMAVVTRELERACACPVTTNVYLTPPSAKAYPLHYDSHDFFIFQLHGSKHWRIFEPGNRAEPVRELLTLAETVLPAPEGWMPGALRQELELEAGDLLYVPRGFGHEAVNQDKISLHLTVGLHGLTWFGLVNNALAHLASHSENLRSTIPITLAPDGSGMHDLGRGAQIGKLLDENLNLSSGLEVWRKLYLNGLEPIPDGYWKTLEHVADLDDATLVCRRRGLLASVEVRGNTAVLRFLQETVTRPVEEIEALQFVASTARFLVGAIPEIGSEENRVGLAADLVRKGFLSIVVPVEEQAGSASHINPGSTNELSAAQAPYPLEGGRPVNYSEEVAESNISPMSNTHDEASPATHPVDGSCNCAACAQPSSQPTGYVYSIGRINARFPSIDIEKELAQVVRTTETVNLTDREVLHQVLSQNDNAYIAREMCWVFSVGGVEAFTIVPRSGIELAELVGSLALGAHAGATNVLIGTRSPVSLPASACGGLSLPTVVASKIYSFDIDEFVKELPLDEGQKAAGKELLERIRHLIDNVGDMDEHRAVNYLALRYIAMYSLVVDNYNRDFSLQGVGISPVSTRSQRRIVDVTLRFVSRKTDVRELYAVRVDVTGMFPFLVTPLHPVFEKD
jgi:uncharacterized RmlC-like cupin family protein